LDSFFGEGRVLLWLGLFIWGAFFGGGFFVHDLYRNGLTCDEMGDHEGYGKIPAEDVALPKATVNKFANDLAASLGKSYSHHICAGFAGEFLSDKKLLA